MPSNQGRLISEATLGMQNILLSNKAQREINTHIRHSAQWQINAPVSNGEKQWDLLLIQWLEEVLYRSEIHQQWLVDCQISVRWESDEVTLSGQVSWVDSNEIEREVEIKAVTSHELQFTQLASNETVRVTMGASS